MILGLKSLIPLPLFIRFEFNFRLDCVSVLVLSMSRLSCLADSFWPTKRSLNRSTLPSRFSHGQPRLARVGPGVRLRLNVERNVLLGITSFLQASPSLNMVPAQPLLMDIDHPAPVYLFNIPLIYYNLAPVVSPLQFVVRILPWTDLLWVSKVFNIPIVHQYRELALPPFSSTFLHNLNFPERFGPKSKRASWRAWKQPCQYCFMECNASTATEGEIGLE